MIRQYLREDEESLEQDTHALVALAIRSLADGRQADAVAVRRALCIPAVGRIPLFPRAVDLLSTMRSLGLRSVIVSNVQVRGADEYRRDFSDLGVLHLVDAVVTSLDVGFRKPHPGIFRAALVEARCLASECAMIGNSEVKDIVPAVRLGMRAIRVAIEEPRPPTSVADAIASDLGAAGEVIALWCRER